MINCLIIDDEQAAIDVLTNHIKAVPSLNLVATSLGPIQALEIVYTQKIDLIFIDILIPNCRDWILLNLPKAEVNSSSQLPTSNMHLMVSSIMWLIIF